MGGWGSGRSERYDRKYTVNESLVLDLKYILSRGGWSQRIDWISWSCGKQDAGSIKYKIGMTSNNPTLTLEFTHKTEEKVIQQITITSDPQPYGGRRYWMRCPFCIRKCNKLVCPPGAKYFGCRKCYDLSYNSCNESHKFDTFYRGYLMEYPFIPRKQFYLEWSGKGYYKYFRTRKAAKKWYAKWKATQETP